MTDLGTFEQQLLRAFDSATAIPVALVAAVAIGAVHGLSPGHGKTLAVGYLVGARARRGHAFALAVAVAAMHTASVLALALLWWFTVESGAVPLETTTRWAQAGAALAVIAVGIAIARRRWRERKAPHTHSHPPSTAPESSPLSRAGLLGIASAGGLLPSPSAFIVLISGLLTGRVGLALGMVVMFGVGLAATVLATGLVTLTGRDWIGRHSRHSARLATLTRNLPFIAASGVVLGGCLLGVFAVSGLLAA